MPEDADETPLTQPTPQMPADVSEADAQTKHIEEEGDPPGANFA